MFKLKRILIVMVMVFVALAGLAKAGEWVITSTVDDGESDFDPIHCFGYG